jgi:lipooligosaccharide transport system ATP-binding protein
VEGRPQELIARYAGKNVVEVENPNPLLREYVIANAIEHDDLERRMVLYSPEGSDLDRTVRDEFCNDKCIYRNSTLEDVFLRLTGRELRE